jgi:hypothetical protein
MSRFCLSMLAVIMAALLIASVGPARVGCKHAFEGRAAKPLTIGVGDAVPASTAAYRLQGAEVHQLLAALAKGAAAGYRV